MKANFEIEQGSYEWHEIKYRKVGGSNAKDLRVKDLLDSALFHRICGEKCEDFVYEEGFKSEDMQRGNDLEPLAREELEKLTGIKFLVPGWIQSDIEILGLSPDGIDEQFENGCEIKCPGAKKYNQYLKDNHLIVEDHKDQICDYFATIPTLKHLYVVAYRPEHYFKKLIVCLVCEDTTVNDGTKAKPVMKTIRQIADEIRDNATVLEVATNEFIESLKF